jgi:signal transduction histidine kinase
MMVMTLLSSILGLWLAGQVIFPVTQLAQQVATMQPDFSPLPAKKNTRHDEVGQLTAAIDAYHQRLQDFNERERAFTGDVSHELRTPLAVIEGATEVMLAQPDLDKSQQRIMQRIARASKQITHLTTALLVLAREDLDQADQTLCSVDQLLNDVVNDHHYLLKHKPVVVELTTQTTATHITNDVMVACNPILLYVLLANIIRNAFSYTQQGTVHICLTEDKVIIEDTGEGIKNDQLIQIFQRHYSTQRSNHANKGHGIGLSLAWRIAQRYGWKVSAHSKEGQGTSIILLLHPDS